MASIKFAGLYVCNAFPESLRWVLFIIDGTLQSEDQRMSSTEAIEEGRSNLGISAFKNEESASLYGEIDFP
jgi:hypothetical protein